MIKKSVKRKISDYWNHRCAICGKNDYLEFHHLLPISKGGTDDYDNIILLCACCHAAVHGRTYDPQKPNCRTSIDYESAKPILAAYFANEIGSSETKEKLNLSQKTHLSESSLYKRYKREHNMNDKVFKNLDKLYAAISSNSQITFKYMRWNTQRKLEPLMKGKLFTVSPCAVSLNDDNYYLIAFENRTETLKHYRIDKMDSITLTYIPREGQQIFKSFDVVDYSRKTFGMFGGNEETVTLEVPNNLAGVFIDRFGTAAAIRKNFDNPNTFLVRIAVNISPQFYAWVFGLGKDVKIISPQSVKDEFVKTANDILSNY